MTRLHERLALAQRGNVEAFSWASSSQTLLGDAASGVEASGANAAGANAAGVEDPQEQRALPLQTGMKHDFFPLAKKFSAINMEHFKSIGEKNFSPKNVCRLHNDYAQIKAEKKYIRMGEIDLQTRKDDAVNTET